MKLSKPRTASLVACVAIGAALFAALSSGSAGADPAPGTFGTLAGVGSDTTQGVVNGLASSIGSGTLASYDATGSATINTKNTAACTGINRPNGSGPGVDALVASVAAGNGCVDFARSSSDNSASYAGKNLTYIPFATDAVTYAIRSDASISKTFTTAQLKTLYTCALPAAAQANFKPLLPKFGSGTRKFFLQSLGLSDSSTFTTTNVCVKDVDGGGNPLEENTGTLLTDPKQIAPYSIAVYLSQTSGTVADVHGSAVLASPNGISPTVLNTGSSYKRDVYNVIPSNKVAVAPYSSTFVGSGSAVCTKTSVIQAYGFAVNPNCGATTLQTP
jgi:ABC-type phosphate transport system substrate-binding protein